MSKNKIIIYSVNTGGYDDLKTPKVFDPNVRYILFTDNKYFKSDVWEVYHTDFLDWISDSRRIARYIKVNPHLVLPDHYINIWIDHCYEPKFNNSVKMLDEVNFNGCGIMSYSHNVRNCIYEESKVVLEMGLDYPNLINTQMEKYEKEGFPHNLGLFDSGFTIRENSEKVRKFNEIWWSEINNYSARDQLSQVYSSWKTGVKITPNTVGKSIYNNKFLNPKIRHPRKWSIK